MTDSDNTSTRFSGIPATELMSQFGDMFDQLPGNALTGDNAPVNVFGQLMASQKVASLFFPYWAQSKTSLHLSVEEQELIILRSAYIFNCDYVWGHHAPVILEDGMPLEQMQNIAKPITEGNWSEQQAILLQCVDQIYAQANLDQSSWDKLKQHYTDAQVLDIITVCSQYLIFNSVNNIFQLKLEHNGMPNLPK